MKKILLFLMLLCLPVYAIRAVTTDEYNNFMKSLRLTKKQSQKVEAIEANFKKNLALLNADILLKDMQITQLRNKNDYSHVYSLKEDLKVLENKRYKMYKQKEKDIANSLNWLQRARYKEYISRVY